MSSGIQLQCGERRSIFSFARESLYLEEKLFRRPELVDNINLSSGIQLENWNKHTFKFARESTRKTFQTAGTGRSTMCGARRREAGGRTSNNESDFFVVDILIYCYVDILIYKGWQMVDYHLSQIFFFKLV